MYEFLEYRVCDAMSSDPITIGPRASLGDAEAIFESHDFNGLPVVDAENRLVGLLTKLDLLKAFCEIDGRMFTPYAEVMKQPLATFMTPVAELVTTTPRARLTNVLEKMVKLRAKALLVVDDETVVGVIAREDMMAALRRAVAGDIPKDPI